MEYGYKYALFGMLIGSVDYMAGNVTKNICDQVFLAIGFRTHWSTNDDLNKTIMTANVSPGGVDTSKITETYRMTATYYNFVKFVQLKDSFDYFNSLSRGTQIMVPYAMILVLEAGIGAVLTLFLFSTYS